MGDSFHALNTMPVYDITNPMRILLPMLFATCLFAQQPQDGRGQRQMPAPKNLKVLKVEPAQLIPIMRTFTAGLGVQCNYCHVQGDFASDEKPQKETARQMIAMAQEINGKFPDGKIHVSCYTCHRGATEPLTAPPAAAAPAQ